MPHSNICKWPNHRSVLQRPLSFGQKKDRSDQKTKKLSIQLCESSSTLSRLAHFREGVSHCGLMRMENLVLNSLTQVPNFAVQTSTGSYVSLHELQEIPNTPQSTSHLSSNKGNILLFFFDGIVVSHLVYLKEHFERFTIADCNIAVVTNQDDERIDEIRAHHEIPFPICKDPGFAIMRQLGIISVRPSTEINNNDSSPQYLGCLFVDKYDEVQSHFPPGIEIQKCIQSAMHQLSNSAVNFETLVQKSRMDHKRQSKKKTMTAEDRLALTWWTKYKMYNRKPYKLIVHFTLALFTTFQIFLYTYEDAPYRNNSRTAFNNIFVNTDALTSVQPDMSFGTGSYRIFSVDDFMNQLNYAMDSYYNLTSTALDHLTIDASYKMTVTYYSADNLYTSNNPSVSTHSNHYTLYEGDLGPFSDYSSEASLKSYIDTLYAVEMKFVVHGQDLTNIKLNYDWEVTLIYDFHPRGGTVLLDVVSTINKIGKNADNLELLWRRYIFLDFLIIIFSIISFVLSARTLARNWLSLRKALRKSNAQNIRMRTFRDNSSSSSTLDGAKLRELVTDLKVSFLKGWFIITLIASIANILGCMSTIASNFSLVSPGIGASILIGIGCSFSWFNCLRYFESFRSYYTLIVALQKGLPNVYRLIVSALPILIGYTLFGMIAFAELSDNFNSFDHSFAALFSTINGDSLYARFIGVARKSTQYAIMARIYEYTFVCIACYAVVNIFIAIIQEAYTKSRLQENLKNKDSSDIHLKNHPSSFGELHDIQPRASPEGNVTLNREEFSDLLKVLKETRAELSTMEAKFLESNDKLGKLEFLLSGQHTPV